MLTDRANGGTANGEPFAAVPVPGPVVDTYGAGDSFAAALCFALARGDSLAGARAGGAGGCGRDHGPRPVYVAASLEPVSARVSWISLTPVKALAIEHVEEVDLLEHGLRGDRRFFLVDERNRLVNNKGRRGPLQLVHAPTTRTREGLSLPLPTAAS